MLVLFLFFVFVVVVFVGSGLVYFYFIRVCGRGNRVVFGVGVFFRVVRKRIFVFVKNNFGYDFFGVAFGVNKIVVGD